MITLHLPLMFTLCAAPQQFGLGVSAGDVTDSSAILWTRSDAAGEIAWQLSTTETFDVLTQSGTVIASTSHDLTVKIEVQSLPASTAFYYRFSRTDDPAVRSRVGRFRTAPSAGDARSFRFVFSGDTNAAFAPFPAMGIAAQEGADLAIWFGDTIYGDVAAGGLGPAVTLEDYRAKYRQIRSDPHVQQLCAGTAVWNGWDDHEIKNDYAGMDPGLSPTRKAAAYQAFFEYMPVREQHLADDPYRTYRRFRYGAAAEFFLLDERQYRDVSAKGACGGSLDPLGFAFAGFTFNDACAALLSEPRQMLGPSQFEWLTRGLADSSAPIKFVVNNVPLSHIGILPYDRWDGYDAQRKALLEFISSHGIQGVVFLTTDIHANAFNPDLGHYFRSARPDYTLDAGVATPEIIAGPWGNETLRTELIDEATALLKAQDNPLLRSAIGIEADAVVTKIRNVNGMRFIAEDRRAYAVIDVDAAGAGTLTYRAVQDETVNDPQPETLYSSPIAAPTPPPCGFPLLALGSGAALFLHANGRTKRRSHGQGSNGIWL